MRGAIHHRQPADCAIQIRTALRRDGPDQLGGLRLIRWDITINSITTIYVLISVGLAVDYAAHIAHMFKEAKGPAQARAAIPMENPYRGCRL